MRRILTLGVILLVSLGASAALGARAWRLAGIGVSDHGAHLRRAFSADSRAALLMGETGLASHRDRLDAGRAEAFRVRARQAGTTAVMSVYVGSQSTARAVGVAIYGDAGGRPGALLSDGVASSPQAGSWSTVPITPTHVARGKSYWLALLAMEGTLHYRTSWRSSCESTFSSALHLRALPRVWRRGVPGARTRCPISAYVVGSGAASTLGSTELQPAPALLEAPAPIPPPAEQLSPVEEPSLPPPETAPVNTEPPTVSGSEVEGQTLSATTGSWEGSPTSYGYQWQDCNAAGEACTNIAKATSPTYKLTPTDAGHTLRVIVTATDEAGSSEATSAPTAPVTRVPVAPVNTALPSVSGSAIEGQALSATTGSWEGSPTSYAYQWEDCNTSGEACADIAKATSSSYKLTPSDVGHRLRVIVTATNAGGSTKATSAATASVAPIAPPVNTALPTVIGSLIEGKTLSATTGTWTGTPTSYTYQWEDCNAAGEACTNITKATSSTYKLLSIEVGLTLRVVVTATNAGGSTKATSAATAVVTLIPPPVDTALPTVSGSPVEGQTLSATNGSWEGSPASYTYQWEDCNTAGQACTNVAKATSSTYKLASTDVGHTLRVIVTATNTGGSTKASSAATATVTPAPAPPVNTALPTVSGAAVEGQTLSATNGSWEGSPSSYTYQWQDCNTAGEGCTNVSKATSSTYKLTSTDVGQTLRLVVTATNTGGSTKATSAATATITPIPSPVDKALPGVSGSPVEGQTLSATTGAWEGSPTSYNYQWEDCNTSGEACADISKATASTYKLASTDVGHTLRVVVTATNTGGSTKAASAATATITPLPAPVNKALPVISGLAIEGQTLSASTGSWEGSPTSYGYEWEDCNTSGEGCANIASAESSTYKLASTDVGHKLRVVVTATNAGGSGKASSAATATVTPEGVTPVNCFSGLEACGFPSPESTGVSNCAGLPKSSGSKTITKAETVENTNITGSVTVEASGVTLKHDCVIDNGKEAEASTAIALTEVANNFTVTESTIRGGNTTTESVEEALRNNYSDSGAVATKDRIENCAECLHQAWTLEDSYVISNGRAHAEESGAAHAEDWWYSNNTIVANHDTLLNPSKQTAVIFGESGGGKCVNHETLTNSLIAGGGYMLYFCQNTSGNSNSSVEIKNNRFARRVCAGKELSNWEGRGGFGCAPEGGGYFAYGEGTGAYFPRGGFFGALKESEGLFNRGSGWEGNFWDNNLEQQLEETYCPKC